MAERKYNPIPRDLLLNEKLYALSGPATRLLLHLYVGADGRGRVPAGPGAFSKATGLGYETRCDYVPELIRSGFVVEYVEAGIGVLQLVGHDRMLTETQKRDWASDLPEQTKKSRVIPAPLPNTVSTPCQHRVDTVSTLTRACAQPDLTLPDHTYTYEQDPCQVEGRNPGAGPVEDERTSNSGSESGPQGEGYGRSVVMMHDQRHGRLSGNLHQQLAAIQAAEAAEAVKGRRNPPQDKEGTDTHTDVEHAASGPRKLGAATTTARGAP